MVVPFRFVTGPRRRDINPRARPIRRVSIETRRIGRARGLMSRRRGPVTNLNGTTIVCVEAEGSGQAAVSDERVLAGRAALERHAFAEASEFLSVADEDGSLALVTSISLVAPFCASARVRITRS